MIIARPMHSKNPASISARPNAIVAMTMGDLKQALRNFAIQRAASTPTSVAPSHTPNAFAATKPISPQSMPSPPLPPARAATMMPLPMASTMRPSTSSITAPAIMDTPSSESIFLRSERMRAVMPTLVAVDMMPMYIGAASMTACIRGICER